jgi:predicted aldo/keto reductase-like oxidoreductase
MGNNNRREFLRKSILGISGAALLPDVLKGSKSVAGSFLPELPARVLGRTGIKTPLLSMGTAEATAPGLVRASYEAGIKLFFSATYYGEGKNEELVGEGLKGLPRDSFVVGTAIPPDGLDMRSGTFKTTFDVDAFIRKADASLKRFGFDHVDILLFPYAGKKETVQHEGVLKAMTRLKEQGKTKYLGIASHSDQPEALRAAADAGLYDIAMIAYNYLVTNKESMNAAIAYAAKAGMGIVAMKTTAGESRSKSGQPFNSDAALKWALQNENVASIVSGMSNTEQLQKNLAMIKNLKLSDQEKNYLNLSLMNMPGIYCQQCHECLPQCPHNLDIPTIMRSYMYAYGYGNSAQAYNTLKSADLSGNPCESCQACNVKCSSRFNIREKILDISRLKDVPEEFILT